MKFRHIKIMPAFLLVFCCACSQGQDARPAAALTIKKGLTDNQLLNLVEEKTFQYFWAGAESVSGLARERYHSDNDYAQHDKDVIATGASGFGMMAIVTGIERHFITRKAGVKRFEQQVSFLEKADRFHGAWPHWMFNTGQVKPFSKFDDGGDLVETAYLAQGMLCARQYLKKGNKAEKLLATRIDNLWKGIEWDWYRNGDKNVLYWHWSPNVGWKMNFAVAGYNECLIMYILAASSPTHGIPAAVYHEGWARNGGISTDIKPFGYPIKLKHNGAATSVGPLFWAQYSYLGLSPKGLTDRYADYWQENQNSTLINRAYCIANPKHFKGYGEDCWGLTASYSVKGYAGHSPGHDLGVISPTAALGSYCYTPGESMKVIRHLYEDLGDKVWGEYGFYDAFSETDNWYPKRYLGIDEGPIIIMIENGRTGLLWHLFMSSPEIKAGLRELDFKSPYLK
ncbi:glucoamylase family protein [Mucilaginibacter boryungensis]|uniref:Beta-glucosidase n=1 Tax=Mucilaginibacter boryungensis TaxID=768480 RepID=A0ABR9XF56_9SPHI|nr:glucoamylase family protein [Mucilaginibacter boryungensis]MBE9665710.1 beta-glucosidase [Mucilaginibacter boryungensis]